PVRAEPVVRARGGQRVERVRRERILEHEQLAEDRAQHPEADDDRARDERLRVDQDPEARAARHLGVVAGRADRDGDVAERVDRGGRRGAGAHSAAPSRTRGLRTEYRMSATSVETRKTTPTTSTAASSAGKSFWVAARKIIW